MANALVVEDELDILLLLVSELESKGHQVQGAGNGEIAMQRVREQKPDIIFVDIMMPVMDGFELISNLRKNPGTAGIPVVLVTALEPHETRSHPSGWGVEYHLTKPWTPWALDCVLERALRTSGRGAPDPVSTRFTSQR